jgi:NADP oxidoreductase coenzyme F420-dependent
MAPRNDDDVVASRGSHEHRRYRLGQDRGYGWRALGKGGPSDPVRDAPSGILRTAAEAGLNASAGSPEEAARFGEIVFCSVPYGAWPSLAPALAPLVSGKVVLDSANPYPGRDGDFASAAIATGEGSGVPVARLLPGARLVRAFNSVYFKTLQTEAHRAGDRVGIPLAGDDAAALDAARVSSVTRGSNRSSPAGSPARARSIRGRRSTTLA